MITTIAIVAGSAAVFVASLVGYAWAMGEAHDAFSFDDERIREVASAGCLGVTQQLSDSVGDRQTRIATGNAAIEALVNNMKALGEHTLADNEPAVDWMNDWQRLAAARAAFGHRLGIETNPPFQIPEADGYPITERMIDVSPAECEHAVTAASQP